ncbi:transcriptional regulator [Paenibacillus sp. YAF4_2]|uniref:transcriptional regulator n=1 Tax=Paenibacillus sp. YAF4_2 TaxID=3233085 RepID=UPI003F9E68E7
MKFDHAYEEWMKSMIQQEENHRRRELLEKGLDHGTVEFLRSVWFPAVRNFNHLYPEWEVRDFHNGYRYLDLAYMPGGEMKGGIEIQGYGPHARDLDVRRFKDLCWRHCLLTLDDWIFLSIAYLSITDEPKRCQQLVLSFIGKFIATDVPESLGWLEAETIRYATRLLRPFMPSELASHLRISDQHARRVLHSLVEHQLLIVASGKQRYRTFALPAQFQTTK